MIYQERINCRQLANRLRDILIQEGWEEIPSSSISDDGYIFHTNGESGYYPFIVRILDNKNANLTVGVYTSYTPNIVSGQKGTFGSGYSTSGLYWTLANNDSHMVDFIINVNKNRIILFIEGLKEQANSVLSLAYIGLPTFYEEKEHNHFLAGIAITNNGAHPNNEWRTLQEYPTCYSNFTLPSYVFTPNGKIFASKQYLGNANKNIGELEDLYIIPQFSKRELVHRDIVEYNGQTFIVIDGSKRRVNGTCNLGTFNTSYLLRIG